MEPAGPGYALRCTTKGIKTVRLLRRQRCSGRPTDEKVGRARRGESPVPLPPADRSKPRTAAARARGSAPGGSREPVAVVGNPGLPRQAHPSARVDAPVTAFPGDDEPRLSATLTLLNSEARPSHFMPLSWSFLCSPNGIRTRVATLRERSGSSTRCDSVTFDQLRKGGSSKGSASCHPMRANGWTKGWTTVVPVSATASCLGRRSFARWDSHCYRPNPGSSRFGWTGGSLGGRGASSNSICATRPRSSGSASRSFGRFAHSFDAMMSWRSATTTVTSSLTTSATARTTMSR